LTLIPEETMNRLAVGLAVLALFLYLPGILLPGLAIEKLGRVRVASVLDGCRQLYRDSEFFLAAVVGLTALVFPPVKLTALLWAAAAPPGGEARGWAGRTAELLGRFGLLDVFLAALLIAVVRLGAVVRFTPHIGLYLFAASALLALAASAALALNPLHPEAAHVHAPC